MDFKRIFRHIWTSRMTLRRLFPKEVLTRIECEIEQSEKGHYGQIVFAVEADLCLADVLNGKSARDRALEVFSSMRVWDTEHNSGVLLFILVADRQIEIVADRGINSKVSQEVWENVCLQIEGKFRTGAVEDGLLTGIQQIAAIIKQHFPANVSKSNELDNKVVIL